MAPCDAVMLLRTPHLRLVAHTSSAKRTLLTMC